MYTAYISIQQRASLYLIPKPCISYPCHALSTQVVHSFRPKQGKTMNDINSYSEWSNPQKQPGRFMYIQRCNKSISAIYSNQQKSFFSWNFENLKLSSDEKRQEPKLWKENDLSFFRNNKKRQNFRLKIWLSNKNSLPHTIEWQRTV
jgi:hypothetical protein